MIDYVALQMKADGEPSGDVEGPREDGARARCSLPQKRRSSESGTNEWEGLLQWNPDQRYQPIVYTSSRVSYVTLTCSLYVVTLGNSNIDF